MNFDEKLTALNLSDTGVKLAKSLQNLWDDSEFIYIMVSGLKEDAKKQTMLALIQNGKIKDSDGAILAYRDIRDNNAKIRCSLEE